MTPLSTQLKRQHSRILRIKFSLIVAVCLCGGAMPLVYGSSGGNSGNSGGNTIATINGIVRDNKGNPLAGVVIALLKEGANEIVKKTRSAADGSFVARILPGRYSLRAEADGYNSASFPAVQVRQSDQLNYLFNLIPVGSGRTTPERRPDRDSAKWRLRSAQSRRSIFQAQEGEDEAIAKALDPDSAADDISNNNAVSSRTDWKRHARTEGVVETYAVASSNRSTPGYVGINFAVAQPAGENLDLVIAGQFGAGPGAPQRLETTARLRVNDRHRLNLTLAGMRLGVTPQAKENSPNNALGQISFRAVDEWIVRNGVIIVFGLDYSRFVGSSNASSITPRLGIQFDANARTRVRAAYSSGGTGSDAQDTVAFEDTNISFKRAEGQPLALVDGRAAMEKSRRFELGIERVLDNYSSVEATAFFDTTSGRGVGFMSVPLSALNGEGGGALMDIANQQGGAKGIRVVYARRISSVLSAQAGYSFGRGQNISSNALTNPADLFDNGFFQMLAAQLSADFGNGLHVRTVFRFSPRATVFAIDPFAGRLAVFDPSLSILVTKELPTFGLPVRAEAVLDARNLLDTQVSVRDGETKMLVNALRRSLRGGISVRF